MQEHVLYWLPEAILIQSKNRAPGAATNEIHFLILNTPPSEESETESYKL